MSRILTPRATLQASVFRILFKRLSLSKTFFVFFSTNHNRKAPNVITISARTNPHGFSITNGKAKPENIRAHDSDRSIIRNMSYLKGPTAAQLGCDELHLIAKYGIYFVQASAWFVSYSSKKLTIFESFIVMISTFGVFTSLPVRMYLQ